MGRLERGADQELLTALRSELAETSVALDVPPPGFRVARTPDASTVIVLLRRATPLVAVNRSFHGLPADVRRAALAHAFATLALGHVHRFRRLTFVLAGVMVGAAVVVGTFVNPYLVYLSVGALGIVALLLHAAFVRPGWTYAADRLVAQWMGVATILPLINWLHDNPRTVSLDSRCGN